MQSKQSIYLMRQLLLILACLFCSNLFAQELTVKQMTTLPVDLSASQYERKDLNGKACALVKVQLATMGAQFEGNVVGSTDYKTNEYWVYLTEGSYMLSVKHPSFVTLSVNFRDYSINGVQGKATYRLTLLMPQAGGVVETQKLIINFSPKNATVLIDSKLYKGEGRVEAMLPVGNHSYIIASDGYETAEGSVKLNANSPRTITENLTESKSQQIQQQVLVQQTTPAQPSLQEELPVVQQSAPSVVQQTITQTSATASPSTSGSAIETITVNGVSFNMIRVEGGTFQMGATSEQDYPYSNEKPAHLVTLSTYYIGETEVTQALWETVMSTTVRQQRDKTSKSLSLRGEGSNLPMYYISWNECQDFVRKLNQLTGKNFRLPTEAEWEYAARGGNKSRGYQLSGSNNLDDVAWYETTTDKGTREVKTKQPNELGLYDMSGNVLEWCQDYMGDYQSSAQTNPTGPSTGDCRVCRGGCFYDNAWDCRVAKREYFLPNTRDYDLGLRLVLQ